jgi:hypothetical protein
MRIYVSLTLKGAPLRSLANRQVFTHALPACVAAGMHGIDKEHVQIFEKQLEYKSRYSEVNSQLIPSKHLLTCLLLLS